LIIVNLLINFRDLYICKKTIGVACILLCCKPVLLLVASNAYDNSAVYVKFCTVGLSSSEPGQAWL